MVVLGCAARALSTGPCRLGFSEMATHSPVVFNKERQYQVSFPEFSGARHGLALRWYDTGKAVPSAKPAFVCSVAGGPRWRRCPRRAARLPLNRHDGAGGDGVEDQELPEIVGGIQPAVLDPGAGLQGREPILDQPTLLVPAADTQRVRRLCPALGGWEQPIDQPPAFRRLHRQHLQRQHGEWCGVRRQIGRLDDIDEAGPEFELHPLASLNSATITLWSLKPSWLPGAGQNCP